MKKISLAFDWFISDQSQYCSNNKSVKRLQERFIGVYEENKRLDFVIILLRSGDSFQGLSGEVDSPVLTTL